jgi:hypothetical protein
VLDKLPHTSRRKVGGQMFWRKEIKGKENENKNYLW